MSWQMWASLSSLLPLNMIILWCTLRLKARQSQRSLLTSSIFCFCIFSYRHISSYRPIIICSTNVVQTVYQGGRGGGDTWWRQEKPQTSRNAKKRQKMAKNGTKVKREKVDATISSQHNVLVSFFFPFFFFCSGRSSYSDSVLLYRSARPLFEFLSISANIY